MLSDGAHVYELAIIPFRVRRSLVLCSRKNAEAMSGMFKKAFDVVKDQAYVARHLNSAGGKAVIKATNHDMVQPKEKHVRSACSKFDFHPLT